MLSSLSPLLDSISGILQGGGGAGCQHDCRNPSLYMLNEQIVYFHLQCTILKEERKKKREKKTITNLHDVFSHSKDKAAV